MYSWKEGPDIKNNPLFPSILRCLVIGESNCGKSCLVMSFLLENNMLDYNNLILVGDSLQQESYQIITKGFENGLSKEYIKSVFEQKECILKEKTDKFKLITGLGLRLKLPKEQQIGITVLNTNDEVPDPSELNPKLKTIILFDDVINRKNQDAMKSYFTRGRHNNISIFYLSQSFFALDRRSIRMNCNFLILFRLSNIDIEHLHRDRIEMDMDLKEFKAFCKEGWKEDYGYIIIDFTSKASDRRYRHGLDKFYIPSNY